MPEKIQEMERELKEAHEHLIELNNAYNELLTKEHEEKMRNDYASNAFMKQFAKAENTPKSEENIKVSKILKWLYLRSFIIMTLEIFGTISIPLATFLISGNAIYATLKSKRVRKAYRNAQAETPKVTEEKKDKNTLYEEVFEARCLYHKLRKEYESIALLKEDEKHENIGSEGKELNPEIYQIYSEYINYVKSITTDANAKNKVYSIKPENL